MDFQPKQNRVSLKHCQMTIKTPEKREHFASGLIALAIQHISTMSLRMSETGGISHPLTFSLTAVEYELVLLKFSM